MTFKLPDHIRERITAASSEFEMRKSQFHGLSNEDLVTSAKFWMAHCEQPRKFPKGELVYDSTFWHIIVPMVMERLSELETK